MDECIQNVAVVVLFTYHNHMSYVMGCLYEFLNVKMVSNGVPLLKVVVSQV